MNLQQGETQRHKIAGIVEEHLPSSSENVMGTVEKLRNRKPRQEELGIMANDGGVVQEAIELDKWLKRDG